MTKRSHCEMRGIPGIDCCQTQESAMWMNQRILSRNGEILRRGIHFQTKYFIDLFILTYKTNLLWHQHQKLDTQKT